MLYSVFFFFKQKTAYEMRISDWSSDVCSSDLPDRLAELQKMLRHRLADIAESDESDRHLASPWQFQIVTARSAGARHAAPKQSSGDTRSDIAAGWLRQPAAAAQ